MTCDHDPCSICSNTLLYVHTYSTRLAILFKRTPQLYGPSQEAAYAALKDRLDPSESWHNVGHSKGTIINYLNRKSLSGKRVLQMLNKTHGIFDYLILHGYVPSISSRCGDIGVGPARPESSPLPMPHAVCSYSRYIGQGCVSLRLDQMSIIALSDKAR